jgi:hypothetical protein
VETDIDDADRGNPESLSIKQENISFLSDFEWPCFDLVISCVHSFRNQIWLLEMDDIDPL